MKANRQKRARQNTKRKNLGTANFADFDTAGQDRIREQVLLTLKMVTARLATPPVWLHQ